MTGLAVSDQIADRVSSGLRVRTPKKSADWYVAK